MAASRLARGWWILLAALLVAVFIAVVDLNNRRRSTRALTDGYLTQLYGGEGGWTLLEHPRQVTSWLIAGPSGHAVLPDRQSVTRLIALLHDSASYVHGGAPSVRSYDIALRFEDELGSMTLLFTRTGTALQVLRDGSPLGTADTTPARGQLSALFPPLLGEAAVKPAH